MDGMMVSAATGVMNSLLEKLTNLLSDNMYKLPTRMKQDVTFMKDELSCMNAFLEKLADMDMDVLDPQTKEWRNQVREMSYDIEDLIDSYMHQLAQEPEKTSGFMGFLVSCVDKVKRFRAFSKFAEQFDEMKTRVTEAGHRRKRYKLDKEDNSSGTKVVTIDPRLPALYTEASRLVGIDAPRDEIIRLLIDGDEQSKVVSIVGSGGLGKTTLANEAYKQVGNKFDCKAFVSVSQTPNVSKILGSILSQINKEQTGEVDRLIDALKDFLKEKRYLIVIDDIWNTQHWNFIQCAFPNNTYGSRVLVTTRITYVAKSCCSPRQSLVYEIKPLNKVHSEMLFFKRIFGSEDQCPLQLKDVSTEIIRKCGGLPLAIVTMSSLLTTKSRTREEWGNVLSSIGSGLERHSDVEAMKKILSLSYNDLDHQLRTCLIYLSMFPEDYEIKRDQLVRRWIGEGFVKPGIGRNLMEKGECYFNELINRSMIQPVCIQYDGQAIACRVHDIILDFITSKALEENFIGSVGDQSHMLASRYKIRRLSLNFHGQKNVGMIPSMQLLRFDPLAHLEFL